MLKWTDEEINKLKELYVNHTIKEISKILNRTECSIDSKIRKLKIKKPINNCEYFDAIDNSNKAYWLGFIWCDGYVWVRKRKTGNEYGLKVDLSDIDEKHLYKLKNDIGNKTSIKHYAPKENRFSSNGVSRFSFYNKHLILILQEKYGIVPHRNNASKIIKNIPELYIKDFIRGIIDADGYFGKYKYLEKKRNKYITKYTIEIGGTEDLLRFIEKIFIDKNFINNIKRKLYKRHKEKERDGSFLTLVLTGKDTFYKILKWIYGDSELYLDRKYEKFMNYKKEDFNED